MMHLKFKFLANAYPNFQFSGNALLEVELQRFCKAEKGRLPIFVDNQFGFYPKDASWEEFEGQDIAVLKESLPDGEYGLIIYRINNGEKIEVEKFPIGEKFKPIKKVEQRKRTPRDKIHFNISEIWQKLEQLNIEKKSESLSVIYALVIRQAYREYLSFAQKNIYKDWISFLCTEEAKTYFELYKLLDDNRKVHQKGIKYHMPALDKQLEYFRIIQNPYRPKTEKAYDPPKQVLGALTGFELCLHYNNHIRVDSPEAWELQEKILEELIGRKLYLEKEPILRYHANPIEQKTVSGTQVIAIPEDVKLRFKKDRV